MTVPTTRFERAYSLALRLYPAPFREAHAVAMLQAFRDAAADASLARHTFISLVLWDLIVSVAKENVTMVRESFARPVLIFNALALSGIATGVALALYAIPQHVLRSGLNDPQIQLASDLVAVLERGDLVAMLQQGTLPAVIGGSGGVDMARSLAPFVIVYDDQGHALASQATLNGGVPVPPQGVFDYVRQHGQERVSWQPILGTVHGVRIAAVVQRVEGPHPGFVLAGRNMREVEAREEQVANMAGLTWLGMLGLIAVGSLSFAWYTREKAA
jgi:hypothetical protein